MAINTNIGCFERLEQVKVLRISDFPPKVEPKMALMCEPTYFEVKDAKNPFMEGNLGAVDTVKAREQWQALKQTFEKCGLQVKVLPAIAGLEDMVFAANQVLPGIRDGQPFVVLSEMTHESRRREVPFYRQWFANAGYRILELPGIDHPRFEGQGDVIWHPGREVLWAGFGSRTEERVPQLLCDLLKVAVMKVHLAGSKFYHLDTAFCVLDETTVMLHSPAISPVSMELIRYFFPNVIDVSEADANNFACNALAFERNVILQKGSADTCEQLKKAGFTPVEVDTSEFMKSGGSVFCLKMMIF